MMYYVFIKFVKHNISFLKKIIFACSFNYLIMKTIRFKIIITLISLFFVAKNFAQKNSDPILLTVAGEKISKSEFLSVYNKNNLKKDVIDKKSLQEYLDLYVNFKLKVKEAETLGLDTASSFVTELTGYRKQLAQPYLTDKDINDKLLQEAYNRMQWDIRASHILIKISPDASPKDTLAAYKRAMGIRDAIMKGESFAKAAVENSDDPSARDQAAVANRPAFKGNAGDLGYFSAFDLVYPFETAAYSTKIGEVSMPVRTDFGYHLVKVTDRKPAMGKVQVAHILITYSHTPGAAATAEDSVKAKAKIIEIADKIKAGASFEDMAKQFSDDKSSGPKGGVIPWFGVNRMVPEFIVAISKFKNKNEISDPVQTAYGWHLIKFLDRKGIAPFDSLKSELKTKLAKDARASVSKEIMVAKIKKEYNFKEVPEALEDFFVNFDTLPILSSKSKKIINDTVFFGTLTNSKINKSSTPLFTFGDKAYTQKDFLNFLKSRLYGKQREAAALLRKYYKQFIEESAMNYEDSKLESKYPEFKSLIKEYRDGILLFELTDQKVWTKAVKDTLGLQAYFEKNKDQYLWGQRLDADIYTCSNEKIAKSVHKELKKGTLSNDDILKEINKDSQLNLKIESGKYLKKDNAIIDTIRWVVGISNDLKKDNAIIFVKVNKIIPKEQKTLAEARGLITADYQTFLEKEWLTELKKKYPVQINMDVFSTIK